MEQIFCWFKKYWQYIVIAILACLLVYALWSKYNSGGLYDKLMQDYNNQGTSFKKQINELEALNQELKAKQEILNEKHKEEVARIENDYQENLKAITKETKVKKDIIIREAKRDPTTLTKRVTQTFGIPVAK